MSEKKYNKNSLQGTVYVLLSAICFSLGGVLIKSIPWNSLSINMVRSVLSFILIFAYQRTQGRKFVFNKMVLLGAVLNFVMALTFVMDGLLILIVPAVTPVMAPRKFSLLLPSRISNSAFSEPELESEPALKLFPVSAQTISYIPSRSD